jgi:hypothetical protein
MTDPYAALASVISAGFFQSGFFGNATVNTPFLRISSILSAPPPSGMVASESQSGLPAGDILPSFSSCSHA